MSSRSPNSECEKCGLYKLCESPVMEGEGPDHPVWLFVGEAPGAEEDDPDRGIPFVGKNGLFLREKIEEVEIPIQKCRFSNAVRCHPPYNDIHKHKYAIDWCRGKILREIHTCNPKVVVLLGNVAIQSVLRRTGITKLNGTVFRAHGRAYICIVHPSYVTRDLPAHEREFTQALRDAKDLGYETKKSIAKKKSKFHWGYIRDRKHLQEVTDFLLKKSILTTDIEGSTLSPFNRFRRPYVGCAGFGWDEWSAITYPIHSRIDVESKIKVKPEECLEAVKALWECPDIKFVLQFGKYDHGYMAVLHDILLRNYWYDTGLASYALNENKGIHGLKYWAWSLKMGGYEEDKNAYQRDHPEAKENLCLLPGPILYEYNCMDNIADWRMFAVTMQRLKKKNLYENPFRFPIMWNNAFSCLLEINGLKLDLERNEELREIFISEIEKYESKIRTLGDFKTLENVMKRELMEKIYEKVLSYKRPAKDPKGRTIELFQNRWKGMKITPDNIRRLLFEIRDWEPILYTQPKFGSRIDRKPAVSKKALIFLQRRHKGDSFLKNFALRNEHYYGYTKYVLPLPEWMGTDGRAHTTFKPHGTKTGRVSSENPNFENLPSRIHVASLLKSQFVVEDDDWCLLEADEKQLEMRLFCDRAKDDIMLAEFLAGKDPHRMGAAAGFDIPEEEVTKDQRNFSKNAISFGLLYGRAAKALAMDMGWSIPRAQAFIDRYFAKYDDCYKYRFTVEEFVRAHKFVVSYFGRVRHLPAIDDPREGVANEALRQAINASIQGDASDLTWTGGRRLAMWLLKKKFRSFPINVVHDANYLAVYKPETEDVVEKTFHFMTDRDFYKEKIGWHCSVPFDVDIKMSGKSLGDMVELERTKPMTCSFVVPDQFKHVN
jgi:uracil-DNA glycosylase family 4